MYKLADESIAITGTVCSQIKETDYKYSVNIKLENKYMKYLKTKKICGSLMVDGEVKLIKTKNINPIFTIINKLSLIFKQNLKKLLPEQEAELEQGILLGDTSDIESDIKDDFRKCNLSHMLELIYLI